MNWFQKLFHRHTIVWTSREHIANTSIDYTVSCFVDIEPAKLYMYKGYCIKCEKKFKQLKEIANIFDKPQPYDKEQ